MALQIVGITDERDTCEKCGKTNLKRVIVLQDAADAGAEFLYYGSDCAAHALMGRKSKRNNDIVINQAHAVAATRRWIAQGHEPAVIVRGISQRYGYGVEYRPEINAIRLWGVGPIIGKRADGSEIFDIITIPMAAQ